MEAVTAIRRTGYGLAFVLATLGFAGSQKNSVERAALKRAIEEHLLGVKERTADSGYVEYALIDSTNAEVCTVKVPEGVANAIQVTAAPLRDKGTFTQGDLALVANACQMTLRELKDSIHITGDRELRAYLDNLQTLPSSTVVPSPTGNLDLAKLQQRGLELA